MGRSSLSPSEQLINAIKTEQLSFIVQHYIDGVDGDTVDSDGNNLLHIAVKTNNVEVVKAVLLLFAYKHNLFDGRNNEGHRPIDTSYSHKVRECIQLMENNYAHPSSTNEHENVDTNKPNESERPVLLSLDGGGIRGLVMVRVLMHIERKLGSNLWQLVNWAAGTSTGGILSLALANGTTLEECQKLYLRLKNEVFEGKPPYKETKLTRIFVQTLSKGTMASIATPKLLITSARVDVAPPRLKLFRNYNPMPYHGTMECLDSGDKGLSDDPERLYIWQVARCTSAAPSFFPPYNDFYADGGIMANNPTIELLSEYAKFCEYNKVHSQPACLISLGTGMAPWRSVTINRPFYARWMCRLSSLTRRLEYYRGLFGCLVEQITESNGRPVMHCRHWCTALKIPFFRISPPLSRDVHLNEKNDATILSMLWDTEISLANNFEIAPMVEILRRVAAQRKIQQTNTD